MNTTDFSFLKNPGVNRRQALQRAACGFGWLALASMMGRNASAAIANPLAPKQPHFPAKAKRVVFIFMQGGPSHVDTFDYKPRLEKDDGKMFDFDDARSLARTVKGATQRVFKSPWKSSQHGECGLWAS